MTRKIVISCRDFEIEAKMLEDDRPKTCDAIWKALPMEGDALIWKEEVFFDVSLEIEPENATLKTESGDVSYWPEGPAICVFFGKSQPVSSVSTFARLKGNVEKMRKVEKGDKITISGAE